MESADQYQGNARKWLDAMAKGEVEVTLPFAEAARRQRAAEEAVKNPVPGQTMPDGTVFLDKYAPLDGIGKPLGKVFNVFAAPKDLGTPLVYADTVKAVAGLKGHYGFNGVSYPDHGDFLYALRQGDYRGEWIIPPSDILQSLVKHKDAGAFRDTLNRDVKGGGYPDYPAFYWSSSEAAGLALAGLIFTIRLSDGRTQWDDGKNNERRSCRPVRLVQEAGP